VRDPGWANRWLSFTRYVNHAPGGRPSKERFFGGAQKPGGMIETLKKVEALGFAEVILYFNVGLKPHTQVNEEMARFMEEVAPAFR